MNGRPAASTHPIWVALVAAYPAVRAGLRALLAGEEGIEVTTEAAELRDLLSETARAIDVIVVDLDPRTTWSAPGEFIDLAPEVGLVLLGPASGESRLLEMAGDRPWAYLLKEAGALELTRAIEAVAAGLVVLQPPLTRRLLAPLPIETSVEGVMVEALTAREHEVLQLVARGFRTRSSPCGWASASTRSSSTSPRSWQSSTPPAAPKPSASAPAVA